MPNERPPSVRPSPWRVTSIGRAKLWAPMPGLLICLIIAAAAQFLADHYGAPQMLFALLLGMAVHFLSEEPKIAVGIEIAARTVLRTGVALLGFRISVEQVMSLGWQPLLWIAAGVAATIAIGGLAGRLMPCGPRLGILSGGSVAVCGASAALAISAILPKDKDLERNTVVVVIAVTTLSTLAMVAYPILALAIGLDWRQSGLFLGGTIHDVAQVVGAGYGMSAETGDTSTIVKLFRVALLAPVVVILGLMFRSRGDEIASSGGRGVVLGRLPIPLFLVMFVLFVAANSLGAVPDAAGPVLTEVSRWCLVTAISALGVKTSLKSLRTVGAGAVGLIVLETLFLGGWVLLGIGWVVAG